MPIMKNPQMPTRQSIEAPFGRTTDQMSLPPHRDEESGIEIKYVDVLVLRSADS